MYRRRIVGALRAGRDRVGRAWPLRGSSRLAGAVLAMCLVASGSAALVVRATAKRDAVRAFDVNATKIESNVAISLKRVNDAAVALATTLATEQRAMTNAELARWYAGVSADGRYPGLLGFTYIRYVPAGRLSQFAAGVRVYPSGRRAGYCLLQLSASPGLQGAAISKLVPPGADLDICAMPGGNVLAASRDSGELSAVVITLAPQGRVLNISVPVYGGLRTPATIAERRARIMGWALAQFSVSSVIGDAAHLSGGSGLTISRRNLMYSRSVSTDFGPLSAVAGIGHPPTGAPLRRTFTLNADGLWILTVSGRPQWTGIAPDTQGLAVAAVGTLIALLVFTVVSLLARNRARSDGQLRAIFKNSPAAIFIRDRNFRYVARNDAFDEMFGLKPGSAIGKTVREVLPAQTMETVLANESRVLGGDTVTEESTLGVDGELRALSVLKFPLIDERGRAYAVCGIASDITDRKQMEDRLQHLADHDLLTGVYNRRRLISELDRQLRYAARSRRPGAVLTFDLDNFKFANDSYGHETGDAMLRAVADVLVQRTRDTDIVARLGGDEFAVVLAEATEDEAEVVARDVRALLCERQIGPPIMTSIGIAGFDGDEEVTADEVLARANTALHDAKGHGADQARIYTGQTIDVLTWVQRIRTALAEDRFVLYGQPIVDLRTGLVTHHELLIRMLSEDGDIIPPAAFLPTAERFGLIHEIDRWVTQAALRLAMDDGGVAINLSGYSIGEQSIIAAVREALADGLDPSKVIFEITETAAMTNMAAARLFAGTLNGMGCNLALDDFGTGFASFNYLKHIPARYLKIDMEFVHDLMSSETDREVVKSIIHVAHSLNKLTIAEGIEDAETLKALKAMGADCAQGFHLGEPKRLSPWTAFERGLRASKTLRAPTIASQPASHPSPRSSKPSTAPAMDESDHLPNGRIPSPGPAKPVALGEDDRSDETHHLLH